MAKGGTFQCFFKEVHEGKKSIGKNGKSIGFWSGFFFQFFGFCIILL